MQSSAALQHADEELALQRDAHSLRIQAEESAAAEAQRQDDELRRKLAQVQATLRNQRKATTTKATAGEVDELAAQVADEEATAEHAATQVGTCEAQIAAQKSELDGMNDELRELDKQLHFERLAMTDSVGQQLVEETLEAQSRKLIHDSALRTFAAVEDRLNEAKAGAEQMNSKSDAQRLQLTKLVREAQAARQQAEAEHQAAAVKQTILKEEVEETRASLSSLEDKLHTKQIQLGDRKRKAASARKVDETKHAELSRIVALHEAELAQVRQELNACANASHVTRDTHGGQVHGAAMGRRLAEQEVSHPHPILIILT